MSLFLSLGAKSLSQ